MRLYLVRHGEAKSEKEDPEQGLTEKGISEVQKAAGRAKQMGLRVNEIFHSPKARASQTARLFAEQLKPGKGIDQSDNLLPMDDPGLWALRLAGMHEDVMLVGHLPFIHRLASLLLCGDADRVFANVKTAGVLCLNQVENRWAIEWMLAPEML